MVKLCCISPPQNGFKQNLKSCTLHPSSKIPWGLMGTSDLCRTKFLGWVLPPGVRNPIRVRNEWFGPKVLRTSTAVPSSVYVGRACGKYVCTSIVMIRVLCVVSCSCSYWSAVTRTHTTSRPRRQAIGNELLLLLWPTLLVFGDTGASASFSPLASPREVDMCV